MKNPKIFLFSLLAAVIFTSCQSVYFTETQPRGNPHLSQIPENLRGNYLVMGEVGLVSDMFYHVHQNGFVLYEETDVSISMDSLETINAYIKDSLLYIKDSPSEKEQTGFPFSIKNDTLYTTWYNWDEKLLDKEMKITEDKGLYYLNILDENKEIWECVQIETLKNDDLLIWTIDLKKEKSSLTTILGAKNYKQDKDDWLASPSKRKFRKYVKASGFSELTHFLHRLDDSDLSETFAAQVKKRN